MLGISRRCAAEGASAAGCAYLSVRSHQTRPGRGTCERATQRKKQSRIAEQECRAGVQSRSAEQECRAGFLPLARACSLRAAPTLNETRLVVWSCIGGGGTPFSTGTRPAQIWAACLGGGSPNNPTAGRIELVRAQLRYMLTEQIYRICSPAPGTHQGTPKVLGGRETAA